ncbi:S41 family peptidase [Priestia taiwanensis]|uniref:C-terminal processing peptidase n=1 Tax=Priestia taiwanensis TaxID=1347902 RepID=A0A917AXQ5_9BACI|nr:S41 family peptidase [Priestia taiwanensis]MBM7364402.1 carboxyl-terminal processing protease [Priestia taiwanensis]GGE81681.1 peptidase S41 [Priestia taiwanensis]
MNRKFAIMLAVVAFLLGVSSTLVGTKIFSKSPITAIESSGNTDIAKVGQIYELISSRYVEEVNKDELIEGAIQGMVGTLKDPFSAYMDKEAADQFHQSLDSSFQGIGAEVHLTDGKLLIVSPIKGSPAEKAGLRPNDQILTVNGESIEGLSQMDAVMKIRGKKGTTVKIEIKRTGMEEAIVFDIVRDDIPMSTVHHSMKESKGKKIGYIQITSFGEGTTKEFTDVLAKLESDGMEGLVIDVRGNPGGYLESVHDIASLFVANGKPIYQVENRAGQKQIVKSETKSRKSYPVATLTNDGSASASEILAAALKESEGYPVIGENTFGKGTVQQPIEMPDGSNLKLTQYKWLTPDGNWIHKKGVEPTVAVKQPEYFYATPIQFKDELKRDMNDEQIKNMQVMLKGVGFDPGRRDGYFSEETEKAVKAFQQANNLPVTGIVDKKTASSIETKLVEEIRNEKNDMQLKKALEILTK